MYRVARPETLQAPLPVSVDLRTKAQLPVLDQGQTSSCTSHGLANAHLFAQLTTAGGVVQPPSRLAIYYGERMLEGDVDQDNGACIRDGIKVLAGQGAIPEFEWPFDPANLFTAPPPAFDAQEALYKITKYERVGAGDGSSVTLEQLKQALAEGDPVVWGIELFSEFESPEVAQTGVVPMPGPGSQTLGGHCTLLMGYDDAKQTLLVLNSWGESWGQHGYFELPYAYVRFSSDCWTIQIALH
jgi:C1A family cysteine protease